MKEFKGKLLLFKKINKNNSQSSNVTKQSPKSAAKLRVANIMHKIDRLEVIINGINKLKL